MRFWSYTALIPPTVETVKSQNNIFAHWNLHERSWPISLSLLEYVKGIITGTDLHAYCSRLVGIMQKPVFSSHLPAWVPGVVASFFATLSWAFTATRTSRAGYRHRWKTPLSNAPRRHRLRSRRLRRRLHLPKMITTSQLHAEVLHQPQFTERAGDDHNGGSCWAPAAHIAYPQADEPFSLGILQLVKPPTRGVCITSPNWQLAVR